ncbi:MAG: cytochrome C oxidase subunit IV family protein [Bacteroidota bacterium]
MGHLTYEESKKRVVFGLILLAVVTLIEVGISLTGKGYVPGIESTTWLLYGAGLLLIGLSLYKAYFIIYEFMHLKYEVKSLALSILLPTTLLIWAIIAFLQEAGSWGQRRALIQEKNSQPYEQVEEVQGMNDQELKSDTYKLEIEG